MDNTTSGKTTNSIRDRMGPTAATLTVTYIIEDNDLRRVCVCVSVCVRVGVCMFMCVCVR